MSQAPSQPQYLGREFKHGTYVTAKDGSFDDALFIKEYITHPDGRREPNLFMVENFKRPFWITREMYRNHKDKKFSEDIKKLQRFSSTQINLTREIARALGRTPSRNSSLRQICRSPYVYGCDVTTPVLFKHQYMTRWPEYITDNTVAALDAETNMFTDEGEPIMYSLTMKERAYIVIVRSFLEGITNPEERIQQALRKYLGDVVEERKIALEIDFAEQCGEATYKLIQKAHEWKPDILSIWNVNFDMKKIIWSLEKYGYDLADVFSDPSVPYKYRHFKYREGPSQKVTASGKFMALHPAEQWHTVETPASFYVLDAMCVYLKLRIAGGKEPSYALDYILQKHLGIRKLNFEEADHLKGGNWHSFMQKNYPIEYCVYNLFDCISLEMLDEKTTDLSRMISSMSGPSEYDRFGSQPRRTCDDLHFECLEKGQVIATTSDQMEDENDKYTPHLRNWIVTLPSHLVDDNGVQAVAELPNQRTTLRAHVADLD